MSKGKDSLILYESFFEATQDLSVSEVGEIWKALHLYLATGEDYEFQSITSKLAWNFIKLQLNADAKKWQEKCQRRSEAGKRGMQKRWNAEKDITNVNFVINENNKNNNVINEITNDNKGITEKPFVINEITKITDTDTESDTESESDTDIFIDNKNNSYPTKDKILKLAKDPSVALPPEEAEKFFDHYTAQSWTRSNGQAIANTPQALVSMLRMWKSNSGNFNKPVQQTFSYQPQKSRRERIDETIRNNRDCFIELFNCTESHYYGDYDNDPKCWDDWSYRENVLNKIENEGFSPHFKIYAKYRKEN
jgi:hypothetical protein